MSDISVLPQEMWSKEEIKELHKEIALLKRYY